MKIILKCAFLILLGKSAMADPVYIAGIRTGWAADQVAVTFSTQIPNPAGCTQPDGIIMNSSVPGFKTHYALILSALAMGRPVEVTVSPSECLVNRPLLWGLNMY
jgi:hypothetical protein